MKTNQLQKNIPNEWQQVKLGDVAKYTTDRIDVFKLTTNNYVGVDNILAEGCVVSSSHVPVSGRVSSYKTGDVLLSNIRPYLKKYWFAENEGGASADVLVIRANTEVILHKFLYVNLYSDKFFDHEMAGVKGVKMPRGDRAQIMEYKLHLPSLSEQNRIVSVLETWDKAIENLNKKIEIKKQIKKGLMQDLLTGKKRLAGFKDKWITLTVGDVSDFINGYTFKSGSYVDSGKYKIITIANVQDGFMFIGDPKVINELPLNISKEQILKKGDILISMTGNVGRVCIVDNDNCLLNQRVGKIIAKDINKDLLYLFLYDRKFLYQMIGSAQGGAQANLSTEDIKEYIFDLPKNKEEQKAIADILTTADKEITELEKKLSIIKEQKRYLLNNLITGAIRTPETLLVK